MCVAPDGHVGQDVHDRLERVAIGVEDLPPVVIARREVQLDKHAPRADSLVLHRPQAIDGSHRMVSLWPGYAPRVTPRAGGEAAKFGERYEGRWTVSQLLRVLAGEATSVLVEDEAALAEGAEFT